MFILSADDPHAPRTYGEQVAPRLRELVEQERRAVGTG